MDESGVIYRLSFPNGKSYIGMTERTLDWRLRSHVYCAKRGHRSALYSAIRMYGADAISAEILARGDSRADLQDLERRFIAEFNSRSPGGYNLTSGGDGAPKGHKFNVGRVVSQESRARMSAGQLRRAPQSDETRAKKSVAGMGNKRNLGNTASAETKLAMSIAQIRRGPNRSGTSGVKGVSWCKRTQKWRAHITIRAKMKYLGRYSDLEQARNARISAEAEILMAVSR